MDICTFMQVRQGFEIPISRYQGKVEIHAWKDKKGYEPLYGSE